jgi:hypothetical protein
MPAQAFSLSRADIPCNSHFSFLQPPHALGKDHQRLLQARLTPELYAKEVKA